MRVRVTGFDVFSQKPIIQTVRRALNFDSKENVDPNAGMPFSEEPESSVVSENAGCLRSDPNTSLITSEEPRAMPRRTRRVQKPNTKIPEALQEIRGDSTEPKLKLMIRKSGTNFVSQAVVEREADSFALRRSEARRMYSKFCKAYFSSCGKYVLPLDADFYYDGNDYQLLINSTN